MCSSRWAKASSCSGDCRAATADIVETPRRFEEVTLASREAREAARQRFLAEIGQEVAQWLECVCTRSGDLISA
jgi:hypothetical protein